MIGDMDITRRIFRIIGLDIDSSNRVIDQDTCDPIIFNNRTLKYTSNQDITIPLAKYDILFDLFNNSKLMLNIFRYYLMKLENYEGISFNTYYPKFRNDGKSALEVRQDSKIISSNYYANDSIKYMDMILKLNGDTDSDLSQYDK